MVPNIPKQPINMQPQLSPLNKRYTYDRWRAGDGKGEEGAWDMLHACDRLPPVPGCGTWQWGGRAAVEDPCGGVPGHTFYCAQLCVWTILDAGGHRRTVVALPSGGALTAPHGRQHPHWRGVLTRGSCPCVLHSVETRRGKDLQVFIMTWGARGRFRFALAIFW